MPDTLRDRIMRIIGGFVLYDDKGGPDTEVLYDRLTYGKADEQLAELTDQIMALLPSLPDGWVDFVQGVADARNGEGMFWTTPDRDQDQDVIDRMGDAAVAMLSARPTPPTEPPSDWQPIETAPRDRPILIVASAPLFSERRVYMAWWATPYEGELYI